MTWSEALLGMLGCIALAFGGGQFAMGHAYGIVLVSLGSVGLSALCSHLGTSRARLSMMCETLEGAGATIGTVLALGVAEMAHAETDPLMFVDAPLYIRDDRGFRRATGLFRATLDGQRVIVIEHDDKESHAENPQW